jgi:hypothetical protein
MIEKRLFNRIKSGKTNEMYDAVTEAALYMATGGFLEEANQILEVLWQQGISHDGNTWLSDLAFQVLWHSSDNYPKAIPFPLENIDLIEKKYREYIGGDHYAYQMPDVDWQKLEGKNAYRQAQTWFASPEKDTNTLFLLEKALEKWEILYPNELEKAIIMMAEISAKLGNESVSLKMAEWWAQKYTDFPVNYSLPLMPQSRHIAPFILRGVLANPLKLSLGLCKKWVIDMTNAIEERMALGRSLVYGDLIWKELLKKLSQLAIGDQPDQFTHEERKSKWIGRPKANIKAIQATEKRLNIQLPDDYKAFLLASNGFSNFAWDTFCEFLSIEEIDLYKKLEDNELYDIIKNYIDDELYKPNHKITIEPYTERAILISRIPPHELMIWLIPPIFPNTNWEAWNYAPSNPGVIRYPSFRHLMEERVHFFEEL